MANYLASPSACGKLPYLWLASSRQVAAGGWGLPFGGCWLGIKVFPLGVLAAGVFASVGGVVGGGGGARSVRGVTVLP